MPVRTSFGVRRRSSGSVVKRTMYQHKVDVDMLNAVKSVLADVSSVSPSSEQNGRDNARNVSQHTLYTAFRISTSTLH